MGGYTLLSRYFVAGCVALAAAFLAFSTFGMACWRM
jgi:hypothetical protein